MEKSYNITFDDFIHAHELHLGRREWFIPLIAISVLLVKILLDLSSNFEVSDAIFAVILLVVLAIAFLFVIPKITKRQRRSTFQQQKTLQEEISIRYDTTGIHFSSSSGTFQTTWTDIVRYKHGRGLILIYEGKHLFRMVPERVFSTSELQEFLGYLERAK